MDEVRRDAELQPPGRQLGEATSAPRAEWRAIVAADRKRQAVLAKRPLKAGANAIDGRRDDPQFDQKTAVIVGYRQGVDPLLVAGAEPALEVHTPLVVGFGRRRAGPPLVERSTAPLHRRHQSCALENIPDRRSRRPRGLRSLALKHRHNLARSHIRKSPPHRDYLLGNRTIRSLPTLQRRMRAVFKPRRIAGLPSLPPLVKRVAANPVAPANLRHAPVPALVLQKHTNALFHPTGLSKWHR